jgi:hypothetical protein
MNNKEHHKYTQDGKECERFLISALDDLLFTGKNLKQSVKFITNHDYLP